ncbi:hypothetical protein DFJ73DRAFT_254016 [Zopfochytrium polystomum]|nr:hypothetical protein DFJ73DRAFT_254016 [Zopfochytrium polystomum]
MGPSALYLDVAAAAAKAGLAALQVAAIGTMAAAQLVPTRLLVRVLGSPWRSLLVSSFAELPGWWSKKRIDRRPKHLLSWFISTTIRLNPPFQRSWPGGSSPTRSIESLQRRTVAHLQRLSSGVHSDMAEKPSLESSTDRASCAIVREENQAD